MQHPEGRGSHAPQEAFCVAVRQGYIFRLSWICPGLSPPQLLPLLPKARSMGAGLPCALVSLNVRKITFGRGAKGRFCWPAEFFPQLPDKSDRLL